MNRLLPRLLLLAGLALAPVHAALAEPCTADQFGAAVDSAGASLRAFNSEAQPRLKQKLRALKDKKGWTEADFEERGLREVSDRKSAALDAKSGELLARVDTLGRSDTHDCAQLKELQTASAELLSVMREKAEYINGRIDGEIAGDGARAEAPPPVKPSPASKPPADAAKPSAAPEAKAPPAKKIAKAEREPSAKSAPAREREGAVATPGPPREERGSGAETSAWDATSTHGVDAAEAPPVTGAPYTLPPDAIAAGDPDGYSIQEIQEVSRGFFGTISAGLAGVIEHAFSTIGRPTGYVLGSEGGGAFLAGVRYGKGTLFLRAGGTQEVYWHGPSIGYDVGAEGSRTLFLIYRLEDPSHLYRMFTGIDGSAYLVGGVGMTLLKGGPVIMAPIRSGVGLRFGANIGYVRFTPTATWNPF